MKTECKECKGTGMASGYSANHGPQGGYCEFPCPCGQQVTAAWKKKRKADVLQNQLENMSSAADDIVATAKSIVHNHNRDCRPEFPSYLKTHAAIFEKTDSVSVVIHFVKARKP